MIGRMIERSRVEEKKRSLERRELGHNAVSSASPLSVISNSSIDNVS